MQRECACVCNGTVRLEKHIVPLVLHIAAHDIGYVTTAITTVKIDFEYVCRLLTLHWLSMYVCVHGRILCMHGRRYGLYARVYSVGWGVDSIVGTVVQPHH